MHPHPETYPQNGIDDPETFVRNGIPFAFFKGQKAEIVGTLERFPQLLGAFRGQLSVDWLFYLQSDDRTREDLDHVLWAAGVFTLEERGSFRICLRGDKSHWPILQPSIIIEATKLGKALLFGEGHIDLVKSFALARRSWCLQKAPEHARTHVTLEILRQDNPTRFCSVETLAYPGPHEKAA